MPGNVAGRTLTRRALLARLGAGGAALGLLTACGGAPPGPAISTVTSAATSSTSAPAVSASSAPGSAAASSGLTSPAATGAKKALTVAQAGDISKLDPHMSSLQNDVVVTFNLFDTLVNRHADLKLHPSLATEWKTLNDTTWEFKLRKDVRFHNGDPFTARDVKFSIERTYDPAAKTMVATFFTTVDHVETPDDYTVHFITKKPDPLLPDRLAIFGSQIMPMDYFKKVGPEQFNLKPVGSGVVKFVEWVKDDHLTLARNDDYWGDKMPFERVVFRPLPEAAAMVAAFVKGEVDLIVWLPPDHIATINKSGRGRVLSVPYGGILVLYVNSKVSPLDNKYVKQAMSWAMDRESIIKNLFQGQGTVPTGSILPGEPGYDDSLPPLGYDPNKARDLLKQGGYKGQPIILTTTTYYPNEKQIGEAMVGMFKDVGLNVSQEIVEFSVRAQRNREKSHKGLWMSDPTDTLLDPDGMIWRLLAPGGPSDYWRDPEFDRLGEEARFTMDKDLRARNYKRMNQLMAEYCPWIPIMRPNNLYAAANFIDWQPYGNALVELRGFNLKVK